ncbi:hypothetical protein F5Y19DRAFT_97016 [Xylariaceae sp. FL1651]|nr:hypothetical protein F5Y19DRAFT_97016 [Xylariaceae sp. FL1651]
MDPLTALSIAASVVQFVDFGSRLLSNTREIYRSPAGLTAAETSLVTVANDLAEFSTIIENDVAQLTSPPPEMGSIQQKLMNICESCKETNAELKNAVKRVQESPTTLYTGPGRLATSFFTAVKKLGSFDPESWRQRLERNRDEMMRIMLGLLWEQSSVGSKEMHAISQQQAAMSETLGRLEGSTRILNQLLIQSISGKASTQDSHRQGVIGDIWSSAWEPAPTGERQPEEMSYTTAIKNSLSFTGHQHREDAIPEAYQNTFQWIFKEPQLTNENLSWSSFTDWLGGPSQEIYWITGKPGAGKSTLMKFIVGHRTTTKILKKWSTTRPLLTVSYYFWNAGSELQKTQTGLLRTLLLQCLEAMPTLASKICPRRWAFVKIFGPRAYLSVPEWTWAELIESFSLIVPFIGKSFNLAMFIDGLDEFDGVHQKLIDFVQLFHSQPAAKICVSSRPWNIFVDAFTCNPSLRMQDLTSSDIRLFVNQRFEHTKGYHELKEMIPLEAAKFISVIIEKAQGVFLWVSIVVNALCEGLTEGDRLSDLQAELDRVPSDLSELYTKLWASIKPQYIRHSSEIFQIRGCADRSLDVVTLWLAENENALDEDMSSITNRERRNIIKAQLKRRLNSRTRGLLEISNDETIDYLHRSVRDWAVAAWPTIQLAAADFDPHLALLRAMAIKPAVELIRPGDDITLLGSVWMLVCICFYHASKIRDCPRSKASLVKALDRLDQVMACVPVWNHMASGYTRAKRLCQNVRDGLSHWATTQYLQTGGSRPITFLGLTAQFCLVHYVKTKILENRDQLRPSGKEVPVLFCAIFEFDHFAHDNISVIAAFRGSHASWKLRWELVTFLVENGALEYLDSRSSQSMVLRKELFDQVQKKKSQLEKDSNANPEELQYWQNVANIIPAATPGLQQRAATPGMRQRAATPGMRQRAAAPGMRQRTATPGLRQRAAVLLTRATRRWGH